MGCVQSKRPRGESASRAVAHCRDRCELLAVAVASRYALADAHRAYVASLTATGAALHDFLRAVQDAAPPPPEPGAGDDALWEGDCADAAAPAAVTSPQPVPALPDASDEEDDEDYDHDDDVDDEDEASDVGDGHPEAQSDDEAEPSLPRPEPIQPVSPAAPQPPQAPPEATLQMIPSYVPGYPPPPYSYGPAAYGYGSYGGGYGGADMAGYGHSVYNNYIRYARSQPPPPYVVQQQHPQVAADATVGYYHDDHHYHGEPVPTPTSPFGGYYSSYPYPYMQGGGGGSSPAPAASGQPPTTPSPPRAPTTWSFLDPFEGMETYYQGQDHLAAGAASVVYEPSQTSTDVSLEDEDLGELEDEDIHKLEDEGLPDLEEEESGVVVGDARRHAGDGERTCSCKSSATEESECNPAEERHPPVHDTSIVDGVEGDNSVVEVEQQLNDTAGVVEPAAVPEKTYTDVDLVDEIKAQFDNASNSAGNVCKMLEVGKVPYYKNSWIRVPLLVIFGQHSKGKVVMQFEEENATECGKLSCSLEKLYMWEKKLLKEVKALEKITELYVHKRKVQRKIYYNGAEAHKLETMQKCVNKIPTKVNISIDIVRSISENINKLRDEELWPQTHEMIEGELCFMFKKMWHTMSECHHMQCHVFSHAKNIESNVEAAIFSEDHIYLVKQLEHQLLDMTKKFSGWFNAQKKYATFLNEWLKRGIEYEPEVTDDGIPPFSPGRLGAPPIFNIYNNWAISIGRISDAEVVSTLQALAFNVRSIWGEKVDISSSAAQVAEAPLAEDSMLSCMTRVFGAMESFTTACENAYDQGSLYSG